MEVRDEDNMTSDLCGSTAIDLLRLKQKPNSFAVNDILPLMDGKKQQGSVYIQAKFVPQGATEDPTPAVALEHK